MSQRGISKCFSRHYVVTEVVTIRESKTKIDRTLVCTGQRTEVAKLSGN